MKKIGTLLILVLILGLSASCARHEMKAEAPGPVYSPTGDLKATLNAPLAKSFIASETALRDLGIQVIESRSDQLTGRIIGQLTDSRPVDINLSSVDQNRSDVNIRVGTLGDEAFSRRILAQIEKDVPKS